MMHLTTVYSRLLPLILLSTLASADPLNSKIQQLSVNQRGLFIQLNELQRDDDWATGVVSIGSGSGPAWAMIDKTNDQYRYLGCSNRGIETYPVHSVEVENNNLVIRHFGIEGQVLNRNTLLKDIISQDQWTQRTSAISEEELVYIAERCQFQAGLAYWQTLQEHNLEKIQHLGLEKSVNQSLLTSAELFKFQPKIESVTLLKIHNRAKHRSMLFSVTLTGNERSGYCGSHPDKGFFIANVSDNSKDARDRYNSGYLLADNHCISSRHYHYIKHTSSGFVFQRTTDGASHQAPQKDCLMIDYNLNLKPCNDNTL